jgi:hypothetical protein
MILGEAGSRHLRVAVMAIAFIYWRSLQDLGMTWAWPILFYKESLKYIKRKYNKVKSK